MASRPTRRVVPALALLVLAACGGSGTGSQEATPVASGDPNLLTAEQIAAVNIRNTYEAVERLRTRWLGGAPDDVLVYVDQVALGPVTRLAEIPVDEVVEIEFFRFAQAIGRFPEFSSGRGVIQVRTR